MRPNVLIKSLSLSLNKTTIKEPLGIPPPTNVYTTARSSIGYLVKPCGSREPSSLGSTQSISLPSGCASLIGLTYGRLQAHQIDQIAWRLLERNFREWFQKRNETTFIIFQDSSHLLGYFLGFWNMLRLWDAGFGLKDLLARFARVTCGGDVSDLHHRVVDLRGYGR
jgi:hypothetical protein